MGMILMLIIFAFMHLRMLSCREETGLIVGSRCVLQKQILAERMVLGDNLLPNLQMVRALNLRQWISVLNMLHLTRAMFVIAQVEITLWARVEMGVTGQLIAW